ncbi:Hsp33 family molecular chaperone HslO [Clostridium formicaceticum]|uniref:33 kDa chaperonin n=1 Tax=Clostridium formicaceticum TaxID=1497 RepID=A0AAC9WFI9_9CLOT|nr:Hsp33 family molecular chaperone HslO [Clostridium formicaceticum]AOY76367.1 Hsp33 family molecular chaperone [Clostridium formicaceticum]ARE86759.1 33 kDa chaperonin [Clostridium formicaceticum]
MKNCVIRATAANNNIRAFIANTTNMVEKARKIHEASSVAIAALGRTMTATSMMGLMLKSENHQLTVKINGGGELGSIVVVGGSQGNVKGYVANPQIQSSYIKPGKLDVGKAVGVKGDITVIKDLGLKDPYIGTSALVSGEIAEDFASYFLHSEQQPSAVALGVLVERDYTVKAAGGFIIQVLPNIEEEVLEKLEEKLLSLEPITVLMDRGMKEEDILQHVLGGLSPEIVEKYEVDFICDCNKSRFERALISIGKKELTEIIEEDEGAELVCHFCNEKHYFNKEELEKLLEEL